MTSLSSIQSDFLERDFSREEIKRVVWDCGGDRAPGPDGFSFKFFTTFWDLLEKDVIRFVREFFHSGYFPKVNNVKFILDFRPTSLIGCQYKIIGKLLANRLSMVIGSCISSEQSAFTKGKNILEGHFILNKVLEWYRKRKKGLMVFKVEFEKAFDSLRWDYMDSILEKLSRIQGDPLSPFLFILAMECLHAITSKAEDIRLIKGATFGRNNMNVSHLMYADDVIFLGEWLLSNPSDLWARVVINIYGPHGGIFEGHVHCSNQSPWISILKLVNNIKTKGIDLLSMCSRKIGNGELTKDCLAANRIPLNDWALVLRRNPRSGAELIQFEALQVIIRDVVLSDKCDSWIWSLDVSGGFSVAST
uniref:RNA-directed DNA polymerase, eukaryota, reverse transcriptase zinc-binding domain protein n=1 Tax=Tanacetum cinerariifolium TaxID=118510 RepID=A0A6L2LPA7_TANCI|nr:RNA-directed DNA polymerase, eukaryota, reverse transcriptase zinc-binding domain protein [Tanacetum cinerariifolium]